MKKVASLIKPYLALVLGALLFLYYLNWLSFQGEALGIGIAAVVIAAYYLCVGILGIVLGEKMPGGLKKTFDIISVAAFPTFMFVYYLLMVILAHQAMGPTGWTIYLLAMGASISLAIFYVISRFVKSQVLTRIAGLFGAIFVLALISSVLFVVDGTATILGELVIVQVLIYGLYGFLLFNSLSKEKGE